MTDKHNSVNLPETSETVEAEALAWVAQLQGDDITEKDLLAFREWVQRSPAHQKEIIELSALWEDMNILTEMDVPIYQADKVSKQLRKEQAQKKWRMRLLLPSVLACFMAAIFFIPGVQTFFNGNENVVNVPIVFSSNIGEQQTHTLQDGTVITLNTNSLVEIDYTVNQRNVRLVKGEALFTVKKDKTKPFLVFANDGIVRAIGTEFSVYLQPDKIDVIVSEGSVELSTFVAAKHIDEANSSSLQPNEMASLGVLTAGHAAELKNYKASIELVEQEAIAAKLSWKEGILTFRGESLQDAVKEVNRYTATQIVISDPVLANLRLGGVYKVGDTEKFLYNLETEFGIVVERSAQGSFRLVSKK